MHKLGSRSWVVALTGLALAHGSIARAEPALAPAPAAAPPAAAPEPATTEAASAVPAATDAAAAASPEAACFPACRTGYLCSAGQCISACNPACGAGERCTATAECVTDLPPPPPPAYLGTSRPPPPPPRGGGVHTHDGFMLRATLGFGGGSMTERYRGDVFGTGSTSGDIDYAGGGFRLGIDVGGALSESLTVHGRLSIGTIDEPSTFIDGADYDTPRGTVVTTALLGVGLTYTFMPLNLYLTGVVGLAGIGVHDDDPDTEDDAGEGSAGPGVDLDVGKEWWVGSELGLGAALRLSFASSNYSRPSYDSDRSYLGAGLLFSLTYQ